MNGLSGAGTPAGTWTPAPAPASSGTSTPTGTPSRTPLTWPGSPPTTGRSMSGSMHSGWTLRRGSKRRVPKDGRARDLRPTVICPCFPSSGRRMVSLQTVGAHPADSLSREPYSSERTRLPRADSPLNQARRQADHSGRQCARVHRAASPSGRNMPRPETSCVVT